MRLSPLNPDQFDDHQREVAARALNGRIGTIGGPMQVWMRRPGFADPARAMGEYFRYDASLPDRLVELAILVTARFHTAQYEWTRHSGRAREAGLDPAVVEAIAVGEPPPIVRKDEQVVFAAATSLLERRGLDEALYAEALAELGEGGLVDLAGLIGFYSLIAFTTAAFALGAPEGMAPPLPDLGI